MTLSLAQDVGWYILPLLVLLGIALVGGKRGVVVAIVEAVVIIVIIVVLLGG